MNYNNMFRAPVIQPYDREKAVEYAHKWAFRRNPKYLNFDKFGGDCTNFASQAIYAGSGVMNYTKTFGWHYINSNNRTPSWTGVDFLNNFIVGNTSIGPFGELVDVKDIMPGDIIQISYKDGPAFNHTQIVVRTGAIVDLSNILIAAHTYDRDNYPITNYNWNKIRFIHILGVKR